MGSYGRSIGNLVVSAFKIWDGGVEKDPRSDFTTDRSTDSLIVRPDIYVRVAAGSKSSFERLPTRRSRYRALERVVDIDNGKRCSVCRKKIMGPEGWIKTSGLCSEM